MEIDNDEYAKLVAELNEKLKNCKKLGHNELNNNCEENLLYRQYAPLLIKAKIAKKEWLWI